MVLGVLEKSLNKWKHINKKAQCYVKFKDNVKTEVYKSVN